MKPNTYHIAECLAWILALIVFALWPTTIRGADYTTVANTGPGGDYCAFPGCCRLPDGRIIAVYYNGTGHVTRTDQREGGGCIAYVTSDDEGKTWSPPALLLDTEEDDRDPSISVLRDGRIILSYFRLETVPVLAGDGVYIAEVELRDDGMNRPNPHAGQDDSLSTVQGLDNSRKAVSGNREGPILNKGKRPLTHSIRKLQHDAGCSAPVRDFGDGLLMLGSYHIDQPYVIRSGDNGKTWQVFDIPNGGKHLDAETDVIEIQRATSSSMAEYRRPVVVGSSPALSAEDARQPARLFYAVMRGANCNGHYSTSTDGKNWTVAADIGFPLHCPSLHRVELGGGASALAAGKSASANRAGTAARQAETGPSNSAILLAHRVPATSLHYSLDECKTWQGPILIDSCGGAYPDFVTLKDGSVLVVYYTEGAASDIRCRSFTLTGKGISWQSTKQNNP